MLLISCPYCEMARPEAEFKYGGEAHLTRPDPNAASDVEWTDYLYFRANPKGELGERWCHAPAAAAISTACAIPRATASWRRTRSTNRGRQRDKARNFNGLESSMALSAGGVPLSPLAATRPLR